MRIWFYYASHTLVNSIRKMLRKNTVITILIVVAFFVLFGAMTGLVTGFVSESGLEYTKDSEYVENTEYTGDLGYDEDEWKEDSETPESMLADLRVMLEGDNGEGTGIYFNFGCGEVRAMTDEEFLRFVQEIIAVLFGWIMFFAILLGVAGGQKSGTGIFTMADVNLLFPSVMKPQSVLLFRLTFQMMSAVAASAYILYQLPTLASDLGLSAFTVVMICVAWVMSVVVSRLTSVWSYVFFSSHPGQKKKIRFAIWIAFLLFAVTHVILYAVGGSFVSMIRILAENPLFMILPFMGWTVKMGLAVLEKKIFAALMLLLLNIVGIALYVFLIWRMKADFYEDALSDAVRKSETEAAAAASGLIMTDGEKKRRDRKMARFEKKKNQGLKGYGAFAFFYKDLFNRFRFARFGFGTVTMDIYLGICLLLPLGARWLLQTKCPLGLPVVLMAIVLAFRNLGNPIEDEKDRPWFILAPEGMGRKAFAVLMAGSVNTILDAIIPLIIAAFLCSGGPAAAVVSFIALLALDFMLSSCGLMLSTLFPSSEENLIRNLIQMFLRFVLAGIVAVVLVISWIFGGYVLSQTLAAVICLVLGAAFFLMYPSLV